MLAIFKFSCNDPFNVARNRKANLICHPMLVILTENAFHVVGFNLFNIFRGEFGVRLDCTDNYLNCILVETTLCDIIFMHYVLNIIYQIYGDDNASILTF